MRRELRELRWDPHQFLDSEIIWWSAGLPTDVAAVGVRLPSLSRMEIVADLVSSEQLARERGSRSRTSPLIKNTVVSYLMAAKDSVSIQLSRNVVYAEAHGKLLCTLLEGYLFLLGERKRPGEAANSVLEFLVDVARDVPALSGYVSRFAALAFDGLGHEGIHSILTDMDHEFLLDSDDEANQSFSSATWHVGETAAALLLRIEALGAALNKTPAEILTRWRSALRFARASDDGTPRAGDQEFIGIVVSAFAPRSQPLRWTTVTSLVRDLDDHNVAWRALPPAPKRGRDGGTRETFATPEGEQTNAPSSPSAASEPASSMASPHVHPPPAAFDAATLAQAFKAVGLGNATPATPVAPAAPFDADSLVSAFKAAGICGTSTSNPQP